MIEPAVPTICYCDEEACRGRYFSQDHCLGICPGQPDRSVFCTESCPWLCIQDDRYYCARFWITVCNLRE